MAANPKLEFFRFQLKHKKSEFRTFRHFAVEELSAGKNQNDDKILSLLLKYFNSSLKTDLAKDDHLKKKICFEKSKVINKHHSKAPAFNASNHTIFGVINGGSYGRDRIISDNDDEDDSSPLGMNKSVLVYFYFLLYLPPDHDEGFFMIHSNSREESVTSLFRNFVSKIFKGTNYNKAVAEVFCPQVFQEEFKQSALLKNLTFITSFIEDHHTKDGISSNIQEYQIKIEATPKNNAPAISAIPFFNNLAEKFFGSKKRRLFLSDFDRTTLMLENEDTKSKKTFEWSSKDNDFIPVVYLSERLHNKNDDGTPDFDELHDYCLKIFEEILPEIRPDFNVSKAT